LDLSQAESWRAFSLPVNSGRQVSVIFKIMQRIDPEADRGLLSVFWIYLRYGSITRAVCCCSGARRHFFAVIFLAFFFGSC
jgi:hypothetical protein